MRAGHHVVMTSRHLVVEAGGRRAGSFGQSGEQEFH
jgi:hypothetical protein